MDKIGAEAVRAFISGDTAKQQKHFLDFFTYLDAQKIRTPKGLDWIRAHYSNLGQHELMVEMQAIKNLNCTLWVEGVREIVSAKESEVKFILSDHPVTTYNYACPPDSAPSIYPNEPDVALKGTQTIFTLDQNHVLILTNLEYAQEPVGCNPLEQRTHAQKNRQTMVKTDALIRSRELRSEDVIKINHIIKSRAKQYIAAGKAEWLYPEKSINENWADIKNLLLPPSDKLYKFGGEMYVGYKDGTTYYQDAFGRTKPESNFLNKNVDESKLGRNDPCGCGSGKKYKRCCKDIPAEQRTTWSVRSIRERNITLYNAIFDILGLNKGKTWDDVRHELSGEQVKEIYGVYSVLWPPSTDIYELLPKSDDKLRGLYSGIIDPRSIGHIALCMTPYFDELLIQHPFLNPNNVKPEYSPIESPESFKRQALKDISFLLVLEPFVKSGVVSLVPDPCNFDHHLHRQMLYMAQNRGSAENLGNNDDKFMSQLNINSYLHTIVSLPNHMKNDFIRKELPSLEAGQIEQVKKHIEAEAKKDPTVLLQKIEFRRSGQFMMFNMTPNYEMSLLIAQVTGSVILTDSDSRWNEFRKAQFREQGLVAYPWKKLTDAMSDVALHIDPEVAHSNHSEPEFAALRKVFRSVLSMNHEGVENSTTLAKLEQQLKEHYHKIHSGIKEDNSNVMKVQTLMPKGGFVDRNVQRLLVTSNFKKYQNSVPIVIFVEAD